MRTAFVKIKVCGGIFLKLKVNEHVQLQSYGRVKPCKLVLSCIVYVVYIAYSITQSMISNAKVSCSYMLLMSWMPFKYTVCMYRVKYQLNDNYIIINKLLEGVKALTMTMAPWNLLHGLWPWPWKIWIFSTDHGQNCNQGNITNLTMVTN